MKTIVISAVNIRKGGTLTILRQCLSFLSNLKQETGWRIVAIVHRRDLCDYPAIEYIELPHVAKSWGRRLWCEYITMHHISKQLGPIDLWFSLHDTTPRVIAKRQAVYCQTSFPFLKWKYRDLRFDPKIVLFALFTRFAYLINIRRNYRLIVQAEWLRDGFARMFGIPAPHFIVAPPPSPTPHSAPNHTKEAYTQFFFPSTADCHKNFELACQAAQLLEHEIGTDKFRLIITIRGEENSYARWLKQQWSSVKSIQFAGFMSKSQLITTYEQCDALVYPSRVETWGLAISEFGIYNKPMLLADLPYAHETSAGCSQVAFFPASDPQALKSLMKRIIQGDYAMLSPNPKKEIPQPTAQNWQELFDQLLSE